MTDSPPTGASEATPTGASEATAHASSPSGEEGMRAGGPSQPSEQELQAAYEAELNRISSAELLLQTAASLLNLGARRLGLTTDRRSISHSGHTAGSPIGQPESQRDLEQVRDAIDGVRALMPILERRAVADLGPLRDALSQLQMAYAREAPRAASEQAKAGEPAGSRGPSQPAGAPDSPQPQQQGGRPGPAESSGRLWVPGR
jgi:hypothetical protein